MFNCKLALSISFSISLLFLFSGVFPNTSPAAEIGGNELYGTSSGTNMQKGIELMMNGDYRSAISYFEAAYKAREHPPFACWHQAICYYNLGDKQRCKQYLKFIFANFPKSRMIASAQRTLAIVDSDEPPDEIQMPADYAQTYRYAGQGAAMSRQGQGRSITGKGSSNSSTAKFARTASGHMIVTVFINGRPAHAMFDTGAETTLFTSSQLEAARINLNTKRSNVTLVGVGGETGVTEAEVDFSVGGIRKSMTIYVQNDTVLKNNQGEDSALSYGLLGEDFFGDRAYTIDDRSRTITFYGDGVALPKSANSVHFDREGALMIVTPKVNGRECPMVLDTGCSGIAFSDKHIAGMGLSRPTSANRGEALGVGGRRDSYIFEIDTIQLGGIEKKHVSASCDLHATNSRPLLGSSFLEGLVLTVDPKSRLIYLQ